MRQGPSDIKGRATRNIPHQSQSSSTCSNIGLRGGDLKNFVSFVKCGIVTPTAYRRGKARVVISMSATTPARSDYAGRISSPAHSFILAYPLLFVQFFFTLELGGVVLSL